MSTELLVAIIGLVAVVIPASVEVWRSRRRKKEDADPTASLASVAQPLREEAVTALVDAVMSADKPMSARPIDILSDVDALDLECKKLVRMNARLRVARGISQEEAQAFGVAGAMLVDLSRAVRAYGARQIDIIDTPVSDAELAPAMASIDRKRDEFQLAFERFVQVAREAAV